MHNKVDKYLCELKKWQDELTELRQIVLDCGLTEEFKWMHPCYTDNGKNIVLLHGFKDYCALLFYKGVLLKDPENILIQQTENTQAGRQIRFADLSEIKELEATISQYVNEAVLNERSGLKVEMKKTIDFIMPKELEKKFEEDQALKDAFLNLTEGRQRGYLLHFEQPKQSKTKLARIENHFQRILDGYGLHDCVCGLSSRMPNCDGSHKQLFKED